MSALQQTSDGAPIATRSTSSEHNAHVAHRALIANELLDARINDAHAEAKRQLHRVSGLTPPLYQALHIVYASSVSLCVSFSSIRQPKSTARRRQSRVSPVSRRRHALLAPRRSYQMRAAPCTSTRISLCLHCRRAVSVCCRRLTH